MKTDTHSLHKDEVEFLAKQMRWRLTDHDLKEHLLKFRSPGDCMLGHPFGTRMADILHPDTEITCGWILDLQGIRKVKVWRVRLFDLIWDWTSKRTIELIIMRLVVLYHQYVLTRNRIKRKTGKLPPHYDLDKVILQSIIPTDPWMSHVSTGTFPAYDGTEHQFDRIEKVLPDLSGNWNKDLDNSA